MRLSKTNNKKINLLILLLESIKIEIYFIYMIYQI